MNMLKNIIIRAYVYFFGLNFYFTDSLPESNNVRCLHVRTIDGFSIKFQFHKETIRSLRSVFGKLKLVERTIFVISAVYDEGVPEEIKKFKNLRIYTGSSFVYMFNEDRFFDKLLNTYIDFITEEIVNIKKMDALKS